MRAFLESSPIQPETGANSVVVTPWFSYKAHLPKRPLPPVSVRPEITTPRLVVRSILPSDAEEFYKLRQIPQTQNLSTSRGRPDRDMDETLRNIEMLQSPNDSRHWYFGAFLASTGEMIGEGGIPDSEDQPTSGWTRCEVLLKPGYWRQGYGTEFFRAIMDSWWELPREKRRHQILPLVAGEHEPGDEVIECVEFVWEENNVAAQKFFAKMLGQTPISAEGTFVSFDWREGREGKLERFAATLASNPRAT